MKKNNSIFCDCNPDNSLINKIKSWCKLLLYPRYSREKLCLPMRIGMNFKKRGFIRLSQWVEYYLIKKFNCCISTDSKIGEGVFFPHPIGITIGKGTVIGENAIIYQNTTFGQKDDKYPKIADNVIVYPGAIIIGDISIGEGAIIGAGAVVISDIPQNTHAAGNPARVLKNSNITLNSSRREQ